MTERLSDADWLRNYAVIFEPMAEAPILRDGALSDLDWFTQIADRIEAHKHYQRETEHRYMVASWDRDKARTQRDECVALLRDTSRWLKDDTDFTTGIENRIDALLAKIKGGSGE